MGLSATELLQVWEEGLAQPEPRRALALLAAADPQIDVETLARLSIGARDGRLLTLRQRLFGNVVESTAHCPKCNELMEWEADVDQLRMPASGQEDEQYLMTVTGYRVTFRLPNSLDLIAVRGGTDVEAMRACLLERCVLEVVGTEDTIAPTSLPAEVGDAITAEMANVDPQADVTLAVTCDACGHTWEAGFDISSFLWTEIDDWARRTVQTVHRLALSYGWREQDILGMSPLRRRLYLEMLS
jgi:hypothetical protein